MFLFESSKEKAIREDVERSMEICISNPKKYNEAKEVLAAHLRGSDQKVIEMIVDNIKATIKNEDYQPVRKYQAMLLLKDLMLTHNKALGKYVVKKILKRLTILAQHKSGTKEFQREEERARDIFGQVKKDQEQYAIKFFNTLLTALEEWGKNWPKAPDGPYKDFHREYNELLMNGVQFPKERPKDLSKSITGGGRLSRQQTKIPQADPLSPPKPKPKQQKKPAPQQARLPQRKSISNQQLRINLDEFYENIKAPVKLFNELLPKFASDSITVISDIVGSIQTSIQAGDLFKIQIQGEQQFHNDELKLQKCFDFLTKVQKDLKILSKKPEQLDVFKSKYTKLSGQLLDTLSKGRNVSVSPVRVESSENRTQANPSPPPQQQKKQEKTPDKDIKVEEPKIKNQNRYASVQGNQVMEHFAKAVAEYNSNSGQSVHSDRFGSFGGPANTDRHRVSIPIQPQGGSPQAEENKKKSNSDRKQQEKNKTFPAIPEQKPFQISKKQFQTGKSQKQGEKVQSKPQLQSQKLFKQFEAGKRPSQKESSKNIPPKFDDNSSFGAQHFEKSAQEPQQQQDFFAKLDQQNNQATKQVTQNPRRKKNPPKQDNDDFFKVKIQSKIDSSKLSGFQFSQKVMDASKADSKNAPYIAQKQKPAEVGSKKDLSLDPFGFDTSQNGSKVFGNLSDFMNNPDKVDVFGKSTVTRRINTKMNENQMNPRSQNPFATGNFGNMVEKNPPPINPFESQSVKSKKQVNNSLDNPFGNSFDKSSKGSKPAKQSVHSRQSEKDKGNMNNSGRNPFQSKVFNPDDNFFDQMMNNSLNQAQNPFEKETQKSNRSKNPFEQIQEFYKPTSSKAVQGLSQRNSFKNIGSQNKDNILGGNLRVSGFQEPIRNSLVFSAKLDPEGSQHGLNFSQFPDIGAPGHKQSSEARNSNPFQTSGDKQDHSFSGFSLSKFPGIGEQNQNQKEVNNESAQDFFAQFEKDSNHSKKDKQRIENPAKQQPLKSKQGIEDFFAGSFSNESKSDNRISNKNPAANEMVYQRQKTVLSGQDKSFDFTALDKGSGIQKKRNNKGEFDMYTEGGKSENTKRQRQQKDPYALDNRSQKSLSWGDFEGQPDQIFVNQEQQSQKQSNDAKSNKFLQVESRVIDQPPTDRPKEGGESKEPTSRVHKVSNEPSLNLDLEDFTPVNKRGIEWNPLSKIPKLKQPTFTYNVDDKKIELKKSELSEKQRQYNEKLQIFKFAKHKNDEIRNIFMEKMKKLEDIMHQKIEYEQILRKIKETNGFKENQIQQLHAKIKKISEIKTKILQKEKQLYELTKNQINTEEKRNPAQRSMASKWQMFNKNLQHNRNSMLTMHSQYSNRY